MHNTVLHGTEHCSALYYTALYYTTPFCTTLYCTVRHHAVSCNVIQMQPMRDVHYNDCSCTMYSYSHCDAQFTRCQPIETGQCEAETGQCTDNSLQTNPTHSVLLKAHTQDNRV